jgi:hypothetical protein
MIYVYTPAASTSARLMALKLKGRRIKHHRFLKSGDIVVNWGSRDSHWALKQKALVLNPHLQDSKKTEIFKLAESKLPVPPVSLKDEGEGWFGRSAHHMRGRDFLRPPASPDFYVKKLNIVEEYRIHVFNYDGKDDIRILRWGRKEPRNGKAHPWIRSDAAGWRLSYNLPSQALPKGLRGVAKAAVKALGMDFGAVDMGLTSTGKPIIFEVNSAPGLDEGGRTIHLYADAMRQRFQVKA